MYIKREVSYVWQQLCKPYNTKLVDATNKIKTIIAKLVLLNGIWQWNTYKLSMITHSKYER